MAFNLIPSQFEISKYNAKDMMWANYTDQNVLFKMNPNYKPWQDLTAGKVLEYVASASPNIYAKNNSMIDSFAKTNRTEYVDTDWLRWSLKGTNNIKCYAVENLEPNNPTPGIAHSEIEHKFSHNLWVSGTVIYPECAPSVEFIVNGEAVADGTGYIYALQLKTKNEFEFVNPELLESNITWAARGHNFSEASNEYGPSPIKGGPSIITFQSQLGSFSASHEVTDDAVHQMMRIRGKDNQGNYIPNVPDQIFHFEEAEFRMKNKYMRDQSLFWGRDAGYNLIDPTTGYHRKTGAGMLQFYEDGNLLEYDETNFTVDFLREQFRSYLYGKVEPNNANIKVKAGIALLGLVQKALSKEYAMRPVEKMHDNYARPGASFPGSKQKGLHLTEPQFMGFDLYPYGVIEFEHFPILDDVEMNGGLVHPDSGLPLTSYWGFVDDIGIGMGANLKHYIKKGSEYYNYICGAYSPAGSISHGNGRGFVSSHSRRSYKIIYSIIEGVMLMDSKRTLFL
ncbi:MAG: hypothetical protein KC414_11545, partial [Romboutsia sp.]|nr:hypothetical protein [Romboutsia sp.]